MLKKIILIFVILVFLPQESRSEVFKFLGARPLGMGGAFVAVAEDSLAQYWNPAGLGLNKDSIDVYVPGRVNAELTKNLFETANNLSDFVQVNDGIQAKTGSSFMSLDDYNDFINVLNNIIPISASGGALGDIQTGAALKLWSFAISANYYANFSASPFMDLSNINLVDSGSSNGIDATNFSSGRIGNPLDADLLSARDTLIDVINDLINRVEIDIKGFSVQEAAEGVINLASDSGMDSSAITNTVNDIKSNLEKAQSDLPDSGSGSFDDNDTNITFRGISVSELSIGFGGTFPSQKKYPILSDILIGGNLKLLQGKVGYAQLNLMNDNVESGDIIDRWSTSNDRNSIRYSIDFGILYDKKKDWRLRSGILFRNITSPSFKGPVDDVTTTRIEGDGGSIDFNAQVRAGIAYWPFDRWIIAADVDLTENNTSLSSYYSRLGSLGTEFKLFNSKKIDLALRAGLYKNLAESDAALTYTAGLGFTMAHVRLDVSGAASSKTVKIEDGRSIPASASLSLALSMVF